MSQKLQMGMQLKMDMKLFMIKQPSVHSFHYSCHTSSSTNHQFMDKMNYHSAHRWIIAIQINNAKMSTREAIPVQTWVGKTTGSAGDGIGVNDVLKIVVVASTVLHGSVCTCHQIGVLQRPALRGTGGNEGPEAHRSGRSTGIASGIYMMKNRQPGALQHCESVRCSSDADHREVSSGCRCGLGRI